MEPVSISWIDIVKIVLASGVVSAVVGQFIQWVKENQKENRSRRASAVLQAIELVGSLDRYVVACHKQLLHHVWASHDSRYDELKNWSDVPDFSLEGIKIEQISPIIVSKVSWMRTEVALAYQSVAEEFERTVDPSDIGYHMISITGYFGYMASQISYEIRKDYKLASLASGWSLDAKAETLRVYSERAKKDLQ